MIGRWVPPAYSPLTIRALIGGLTFSVKSGDSEELLAVLQRRYHSDKVVLCDSGTSALTLALRIASKGVPDPLVALPAYGCYDLATAAIAVGANVVLYDLDPETLAPDPVSFARALQREPCAVVIAYLYGIPFDVAALSQQAADAGAVLIEDAAQGFGASVGGMPCGGTGPLGVLSFGRGKGATGGGGGALLMRGVVPDDLGSLPAESGWAGWGKAVVQWAIARPWWYWLPASVPFLRLGETIYHEPHPVGSMPLIQQRVLLRLLGMADREAEVRKRHARRLADLVGTSRSARPVRSTAGTPGFLRYPILCTHARLCTPQSKRVGIMSGYPMTLGRLPALSSWVRNTEDHFSGAERLASELFTLPTHSLLCERDFTLMASLIA